VADPVRVEVPRAPRDPGALTRPDLSQSPRLVVEQWESRETADVSLAWGCIRGDSSEWSRDATDIAQGKLAELASATAARMRSAPTPMHWASSREDGRERTLIADDSHAEACARTFVAFTADGAHGCFVACAPKPQAGNKGRCEDVAASASLVGELREPPPPGIVLGTLGFVVHHPHGALLSLAGVLALGAVVAIVTRARPGRYKPFPH
jgi:hypothetical protein